MTADRDEPCPSHPTTPACLFRRLVSLKRPCIVTACGCRAVTKRLPASFCSYKRYTNHEAKTEGFKVSCPIVPMLSSKQYIHICCTTRYTRDSDPVDTMHIIPCSKILLYSLRIIDVSPQRVTDSLIS